MRISTQNNKEPLFTLILFLVVPDLSPDIIKISESESSGFISLPI